MKRIFDIIISFCALGFLTPLLFSIIFIIKHHDNGPPFYRGVRVGVHYKVFRMLKFRTMVVDAERVGGPTSSACDSRVTSIGRWLRKYKLDELPQLFNVLKGEMSLVGPRPEVKSEVDRYGAEWIAIFTVRPGITDLASIEFRNEGEIIARSGIDDPHEAYRELIQPRKMELQKYYAMYHSIRMDLKIIFNTVFALISHS